MNLCIVHRDRRAAVRRVEPEFEKMRGNGVELLTFNTDALSAERRTEILDELATKMRDERARLLLHSIAFGNLKLIAPERPRPTAGEGGAAALAAKLGVDPDTLRGAVDELFAEGQSDLHTIASAPQYSQTAFLDHEDFARTIYCMGTSMLDWTQDLLARGLFADDARVFGLTSEGNTLAWKGYAAVAAAKVSLESVARSIAVEMAPYGVRCNVIQAGVTETPALAAIPGSAHLKAQALGRNPFGRLTTPRDVANVIALLTRDEASWVNGEVIRVDGGEHISGATS
ncbi:MAG: SDR family oxidoreductase [Deltaproteobacteria bacterium]|nr:SDR family oxidoreductase [Deltaproteobacteria bacterium]MBW2359480.1 SDR family oxidoreductase [Deltaproteobacteria bacterium]